MIMIFQLNLAAKLPDLYRGSALPLSTQVHGFKPGRSRQDFQGRKILSAPSFGGEVKPLVPCRRFTACKISINVMWKSTFRQNSCLNILTHKFHLLVLGSLVSCRTLRHLAVKVGTSKT
jgi:hypothetical protein